MDIENPEFLLFLKCAKHHNLRYMCVGGYAVNYFGYHRVTEDMDIWIAPTNENKTAFLNTLICMNYTETEVDYIREEDFTTYFMLTIGNRPHVIDVLTIMHRQLNFDDAEKHMIIHQVGEGVELKMVPYDYLREMKLRSTRPKDQFDIARLEELRNKQQ
jgi:hypothetical protein